MRRAHPETDHLLLYGWGFLVSAVGALPVLLSARWPWLTACTLLLLAAGFITSWRLRNSRVSHNSVTLIIVGALLLFMTAAANTLGDVVDEHPYLSELGREGILALMILALIVLRSFALYTPGDVIFSIVPGIAAFGLLAGTRPEPAAPVAFVVFIFASICLTSHEHYLSQQLGTGAQPVRSERVQWMAIVSGLSLAVLTTGFGATLASAHLRVRVPMATPPVPMPSESQQGVLGLGSASFLEPRNSVEIGTGPAELSERIIFTVQADELHYWRMRTYEKYNGHGWETDDRYTPRPGAHGRFELTPPAGVRGLKRVNQSFSFQVPTAVLVAAPQPVRYDIGGALARYVRYLAVDRSGGARLAPRLPAYAGYSVVSYVPPPAQVPLGGTEPPLPSIEPEYLRVPLAAQRAAEPLVRQVTAGQTTLAGKALALRDFVSRHGRYDLEAPPVPRGEDVVAHFLRSHRPRAYCDVFASALAIMCRVAGVPARFAVGFLPGDFNSELDAVVVTDRQRHAWAEVYLPGQGWTPLDATPPADPQQGPAAAQTGAGGKARPLKWLIPPAALLAAGVAAWVLRLRGSLLWFLERLSRAKYPAGPRGALMQLYARALHLLASHGLHRHPSQTPAEYVAHLRASVGHALGDWLDSLAQLTQDFMHARYSIRPVPAEQVERARAIVQQGEQELRRKRRLLRRTA